MTDVQSYFFSVLCTALICGILVDLSEKTFFHKQIQMVCSVFLALALFNPLIHNRLPNFTEPWERYWSEAKEASARGEFISQNAKSQIIKHEVEAYILEEAKILGAELRVDITMDDGVLPTPQKATIYGCFDADTERALQQILVEAIRIPKEQQTWIRQDSNEFGVSYQNTSTSF